jgi:hypothetical protein
LSAAKSGAAFPHFAQPVPGRREAPIRVLDAGYEPAAHHGTSL